MFVHESDAAWKKLGEQDPYFGVLHHDRFHRAQLNDEARREFFASGEEHVERLFEALRELTGAEVAPRRALDFGCGVGRILIPLARRSSEAVGVDISEGMLAEARRNCEQVGVSNAHFATSAGNLARLEGTFDFIHTYIVLQHIPVERGMTYVEAMLDRLEPGGAGAVHVTYAKSRPLWKKIVQRVRATVPGAHGVANLLQSRPFSDPLVQMNDYSLSQLFLLLQAHDCTRAHVHLTDHGGYHGAMFLFQKGGPRSQF
jgi:2-polyprenyl-3-methyl-5-hydroxy-6-metoxy-1,4-benzoquinol methylase